MRRRPVFRRRERLGLTAMVLAAYVLSTYVAYASVSVLLDGRSPIEAFSAGLNSGWALLPLTLSAALLAAVLFGVLGLARRPERRGPFAVIAALTTVGALRSIVLLGDVISVAGGIVQYLTPADTLVHFLSETMVGAVVTTVAALAASIATRHLLSRDRRAHASESRRGRSRSAR